MMNNNYNEEGKGIYTFDGEMIKEVEITDDITGGNTVEKKSWKKSLLKKAAFVMGMGLAAYVMFQAGSRSTGQSEAGSGAETILESAENNVAKVELTTATTAEKIETDLSGVSKVAADAMPAIVAITNTSTVQFQDYFGGGGEQESESCGSGIIIGKNDTELLMVTNNHVIEGADTLTISFVDDAAVEAQVKGVDSANDLAVVAAKLSDISEETMDKIKVIAVGDSEGLVVGEQVVAIGNALGYGQSVTTGIVSALNREVTIDNVTSTLIQTDAAINPGNSGGALLNMQGELIGINSAKFASEEVEGMGYAIPTATASSIIEGLMNQTTREKVDESKSAYIGIQGESVSSGMAQAYNIPEGVYIIDITENTPAASTNLQVGDIITKFDNTEISSMTDLQERLAYYEAGETVEIIVQTLTNGDYVERKVSLTLGAEADYVTEETYLEGNYPNESY